MGCAQGFPDVSLLPDLSDALGTDMTSLLSGQRNEKEKDGGNMKRIQFYICPACGNILTATGGAEIACCGRKLGAMKAQGMATKRTRFMSRRWTANGM